MRWVAQLHYNSIRNIEAVVPEVHQRPSFRAFQLADDLYLTRGRVFYRVVADRAVQISFEEVSANYNLEAMQLKYRTAVDAWKNMMRGRNRKKRVG